MTRISATGQDTGFTPGPWQYTRRGHDHYITDHEGDALAAVHREVWDDMQRKCKPFPLQANARLIAAAPWLYDAAEDSLAAFKLLVAGLSHDRNVVDMIKPHIDELETALAKVRP